jgi:inorganic pyrophosphatase
VDVLVVSQAAVVPGAVVPSRPVGVLLMEDENGPDEKIVAVPVDRLNPYFSGIKSHEDLPTILRDQISHFFRHYKDLEEGKWVKVMRWAGPDEAHEMIRTGIDRADPRGNG